MPMRPIASPASPRGETMGEQRRNPADRAGPALDIEQREIALGRSIEFEYLRDCKARCEGLPDIAAQPVADGEPQPVLRFERAGLCFQQIAAEFADILEH